MKLVTITFACKTCKKIKMKEIDANSSIFGEKKNQLCEGCLVYLEKNTPNIKILNLA